MKKLYNKLTNKKYFLNGTIGVGLCLLALVGALNTGIISNFITWIVSFLFGWTFYIFYFVLFLFGLKLIFSFKEFKIKFGLTIGGAILLVLGLLILTTNKSTYVSDTDYLTFTNFFDKFSVTIQGFPQVQFNLISGGFIGFLIVALINTGMTQTGSIIFGLVFTIVGAILFSLKTIIKIIKKIKKYNKEKNKNVEVSLSNAEDLTQFDTDEVGIRPTTVVTANDDLPSSNRQTTVIRNPENGSVGTAYVNTSPIRYEFQKAKFDPKEKQRTQELEIHESENPYHDDFDIETTISNSNKRPAYTIDIDRDEVTSNVKSARYTPTSEIEVDKITDEDLKKARQEINKESLEGKNTKVLEKKIDINKYRNYTYPPLDLLIDRPSNAQDPENLSICESRMKIINEAFNDFGIGAKVVSYTIGPSVTRYDVQMNRDQSAKNINSYVDDISIRLGGIGTRFVQVVPGRTTSGLEIPNAKAATVNFKDCINYLINKKLSPFNICFGEDISTNFVNADLREFPHLLVCGTTGSGKSVFIHSLIVSLIMRNKPSDMRLLLIDPKHVEFNKYKNLPFLLAPVVNDAQEAVLVLNQLCDVMEERYQTFEEVEVDSIEQYNKYQKDHSKETMPYIFVVIDEYADLVDHDKQVSTYVTRLAAKARACGIHLIVATQRPSTNVITGVIKSNIPTRIALLCASSTDSQTILGCGGAEKLLGYGDMLVKTPLVSKTENVRVQGSYIGIDEIKKVVGFLKEHYEVQFEERFCNLVEKTRMQNDQMKEMSFQDVKAASDEEKYIQIREYVMTQDYCSISKIQRSSNVGFNRAGKIFDRLVEEGVIEDHDEYPGCNKGRKVILKSIKPEVRSGSIEQSEFNPDKI